MAYSRLTEAIKAVSPSVETFCLEKLGLKYQTYTYRLRAGRLTVEDAHKICFHTGRSFDDLFPNPLSGMVPLPKDYVDMSKVKVVDAHISIPSRIDLSALPPTIDEDSDLQSGTDEPEVELTGFAKEWAEAQNKTIPEGQKKEEEVSLPPLTKNGFKPRSINLLSVPEPERKVDDEVPQWKPVEPLTP